MIKTKVNLPQAKVNSDDFYYAVYAVWLTCSQSFLRRVCRYQMGNHNQ